MEVLAVGHNARLWNYFVHASAQVLFRYLCTVNSCTQDGSVALYSPVIFNSSSVYSHLVQMYV